MTRDCVLLYVAMVCRLSYGSGRASPMPIDNPLKPHPLTYIQVEPGKKVTAIVQVADHNLRAQLEQERDILALLGR